MKSLSITALVMPRTILQRGGSARWFQLAHPQETVGNMFYGPGVLTMLYANGLGVSRDYGLAIRFACERTIGLQTQRWRIASGTFEHLSGRRTPGREIRSL